MEVGEEGEFTYRYTVTTRLTCTKMGSDESHFNVSLVVRDKVTRQCPQTTTFEEKGELKRYRTESFRLPAHRLTARPNRLSSLFRVPYRRNVVKLFRFSTLQKTPTGCKKYSTLTTRKISTWYTHVHRRYETGQRCEVLGFLSTKQFI